MSNKISTKSYAVKRLRDSGFSVDKADFIVYKEGDNRKWSIIIDGGVSTIFTTCYKDGNIQLYDGGRFLNANLKLNTDSIEVLIEYLNDRGITNKHRLYGKPSTVG